jgi:hypothetical protein
MHVFVLQILSRGGKPVYLGSRSFIYAYFKALGYTCPENTNPPDYYIDVVQGKHGGPDEASIEKLYTTVGIQRSVADQSNTLDDIWRAAGSQWVSKLSEVASAAKRHRVAAAEPDGSPRAAAIHPAAQLTGLAALNAGTKADSSALRKPAAGLLVQTWLSFRRALLQHTRGNALLLDVGSQFVSELL